MCVCVCAAMSTTFTMRVKTGEKKNAGTDANVFAILYGTKDDTGNHRISLVLLVLLALHLQKSVFVFVSGIINLKASKNHKNKFELGMIDEFTIEAVDIGKLKRIRIGHDNAGAHTHIKYHSINVYVIENIYTNTLNLHSEDCLSSNLGTDD